jgi:hypothetical protein
MARFMLNFLTAILGALLITAVMLANTGHAEGLPHNKKCAIVDITPPILPEGDKGTISIVCIADVKFNPGDCSVVSEEKHGFDDPLKYITIECPAQTIYDISGYNN